MAQMDHTLDCHYDAISASWHTEERNDYAKLVVPTGNAEEPIHRWFHLKEAYSHRLLQAVMHDTRMDPSDGLNVVDPFCGVGTTLLSAIDLIERVAAEGLVGRGFEVNPFLHTVATTKLDAAAEPPSDVLDALAAIRDEARLTDVHPDDFPKLSTFRNDEYFPREHVRQVVALRKAVDQAHVADSLKNLARVAVSMTVEPASQLRRDGRTLRFEARQTRAPFEMFETATKVLARDLDAYRGRTKSVDVEVTLGSSVENTWAAIPNDSADLVLFSPPYPNNIDYTEVYKTELWALGFINSSDAFRGQRHRTVRSHPSVKFNREVSFESDSRRQEVVALIEPLLDAVDPTSRYRLQLKRMLTGYTDDMLRVMDSAFKALRGGGQCVYVVGNSVHGAKSAPLMIAADVLLGRLGELAGFDVEAVRVARSLPRRNTGSKYVRESVVFLRKP